MPHISAAAAAKTETKQLGTGQKMEHTEDNENGLQQNHKLVEANISYNIDFVHYDKEKCGKSNECSKQGDGGTKYS